MNRAAKRRFAAAVSAAAALAAPVGAAGSMGAAGSADRATPGEAWRERTVHRGEELFQVILPMETSHVFDFIMDPERLIEKTEAAAYGGDIFEEGATLFFRCSDGRGDADYCSFSDALTITNKGSRPVAVTLRASVDPKSLSGILLSDDRDFTDDWSPGLYLALTDGEQTVPAGIGEESSVTAVVEGAYSFWLTGSVNEKGDWSGLKDTAPKVTVTWTVSPWDEGEALEKQDGAEVPDGMEMPETEGTPGNGERDS